MPGKHTGSIPRCCNERKSSTRNARKRKTRRGLSDVGLSKELRAHAKNQNKIRAKNQTRVYMLSNTGTSYDENVVRSAKKINSRRWVELRMLDPAMGCQGQNFPSQKKGEGRRAAP
jgi:hypothetical protein